MSRGRLIKEEEDTDVRMQTPARPVRGVVLELAQLDLLQVSQGMLTDFRTMNVVSVEQS